jgi:hypothetical protein
MVQINHLDGILTDLYDTGHVSLSIRGERKEET